MMVVWAEWHHAGSDVILCVSPNNEQGIGEVERLVDAAPDMLSALKEVAAWFSTPRNHEESRTMIENVVNPAIAKATGEEETTR